MVIHILYSPSHDLSLVLRPTNPREYATPHVNFEDSFVDGLIRPSLHPCEFPDLFVLKMDVLSLVH